MLANNLLRILFLSWCFFKAESLTVKDATSHCIMVSVSEGELTMMKDIAQQLHEYLQVNMKSGHEILSKVMQKYASISLKVPLSDPLMSHIFHLQLLLHQQTLEMFQRLEATIVHSSKLDYNSTDKRDTKEAIKDNNIKFPKPFELGGLNYQKLGSESEWAIPENMFYSPTDSHFRPHDCSDLLMVGATQSGVYDIYPYKCTCSESIKVYCDMETDGGGWTVILARMKQTNQLNFTRNWDDYKNGFGSPDKEYYLGNEYLHMMSTSRKYHIRLDIKGEEGRHVWGEWKTFSVGNEVSKYKLSLTGFDTTKGTIYDRLTYHNNMKFTTFDDDNDANPKANCPIAYTGGWWFNNCFYHHLTGLYGDTSIKGLAANPWSKTDKLKRNIIWTQFKMRPSICSETVSVAALNTHNCLNRK